MVPYRFLLFLIATLCCSPIAANDGEIKKHRLQQLTQEAYEETGGRSAKISLNTEDYKNLLLENPRPYHAFVLITAPGAVCDVCGPIGEAFDKAAMSHYMAGAVGEGEDDDDEPVFFVEMNAFHNRDLQRLHGFKSVPHLVHLHGGSKLKYRKSLREYQIASSEVYHQTKLEPPVGDILDWMNTKTGRHVEVYTTQQERVMHAIKIWCLILAAIGLVIYGLYAARRWHVVCIIAALLIEMISTSGIFYNLLNGMIFSGRDRNGNTEYILKGFRGQYLGEGLFCSSMMIVSGLSLLAAVRAPYWMTSRKSRFLSMAFLGMSLLSGWSVWQCYKYKTGLYASPGWFPELTAKHGSIRNDQGFTF